MVHLSSCSLSSLRWRAWMLYWPWADFSLASAWASLEMAALRARVQFAHRLGVLGQRLLGRLGKFVFQEQVARGLGGLHLEPAVLVGDLVASPGRSW